MVYAPVIIPTLNRYDHFRQCLESLEKCTGADCTEVYVGLDFPPVDKDGTPIGAYVEGWKKIDEYLHEKESDNGFKSLVVFRRDHNCGVGKPGDNFSRLIDFVCSRYDRYIASEDDNIFSPDFLEYMNKGLEKFKDDHSVLAINGYCHPYDFKFSGNNHFSHDVDFSAWGYGIWTDRVCQYKKEIREEDLFRKTLSLRNLRKVKADGYNRLLIYVGLCLQKTMKDAWITDSVLSAYMAVKDMVVIMPAISKVRNIGWDLSGNSFRRGMSQRQKMIAARHNEQKIDPDSTFEYEGNPMAFFDENRAVAVAESDGRISAFTFLHRATRMVAKLLIRRLFRS